MRSLQQGNVHNFSAESIKATRLIDAFLEFNNTTRNLNA